MRRLLTPALGCLLLAANMALAETAASGNIPTGIDPGWYGKVIKDIQASEYHINWQEQAGAYQSPNRAQNLRFTYYDDGFAVVPREKAGNDWSVKMSLSSHGRTGGQEAFVPGRLMAAGDQAQAAGAGLTIRYKNESEGMRQDFVVEREPLGQGELMLVFSVEKSAVDFECSDGRGLSFVMDQPGGAVVYSYSDMKVYDAGGQALPGRFERMGNNSFAILVDDSRAAYPVTIDPLSTSPNWTAESNQASAYLGSSVATAGDVNGDGYSDVIVGVKEYDNGQYDEGLAYVYHGSSTGLSTSPNWTAESDQAYAGFGNAVATAGDVNGDGYNDVIVGAYYYNNGETGEGCTFVYHGSVSGLSVTPNWMAESDQEYAIYGYSVATAGDVNGDGYSDVIVGANEYDNGQTNEGRAFVFHGGVSGLSAAANWTAESDQVNAFLGHSVASAGDVNGDGYSDVIVGAPYYNNGHSDEGCTFVYHGSATGLSATANWTAESEQDSANFGYSVATTGDVNGDGYSDVIVGANEYDNGQTNEGRAFVYYGASAGLSTSPAWTAESDQAEAYFGNSLATAGDVNGDGYSDVIVGAYFFNNGQLFEGRVFVYHGGASGLSTTASWTAESNQAYAYYGNSVATAGDVNGDGYSDVIVGAPGYDNGETEEGRAFVYHGGVSGLSVAADWTAESDQAEASLGYSVATAGDVNGDGFSDVIVGAPYYENICMDQGRVFMYLGSSLGLSTTASWTAEPDQENTMFGSSVATAGDVNGDGYSDVIVGAYLYDNDEEDEGRAFVYHGSASGLSSSPNWTTEPDMVWARYGVSVAAAGDVNGDGYGDVAVGSWYYSNEQSAEGRIYVYHGSAAGLPAVADFSYESDQESAQLGYSVAGAGDVNGDGYSDVIAGAYGYDNGQADEGRAFLFYGTPSGLLSAPGWTAESEQANAYFGISVSGAGDVNGDGYSDVIVGAYGYDNGQSDEGRAYVYYGSSSGLMSGANWSAESNQASASFGWSVATAGDVNDDGYSDVIVGAYSYDNGHTDEGRAFVYHGASTGLSTSPAWTAESDQASAAFGYSVAAAGDVNGDGYSEVIVGAHHFDNGHNDEGRAFVYYGNGSDGMDIRPRQFRADLSRQVVPPLMTYADNQAGLGIYGRTFYGRGDVRAQFEIKPLGTAFSGTGLTETDWMDTDVLGVQLNRAFVLASRTNYKWRARIKYRLSDGATQPYGRWLYQPYNGGLGETDFFTCDTMSLAPKIFSIVDITGDQGGKLKLTWQRSSLDVLGNTFATEYTAWRRYGSAKGAEYGLPGLLAVNPNVEIKPEYERYIDDGKGYLWECLINIPVMRYSQYAYTVPTLYDSCGTGTNYEAYRVIIHTTNPDVYYISAVDSGYSVDNLAPAKVLNLAGSVEEPTKGDHYVNLHWNRNTEYDLAHYNVHRDVSSGFVPGPGNLIKTAADTAARDTVPNGTYFYRVCAVDVHGNVGLASDEFATGALSVQLSMLAAMELEDGRVAVKWRTESEQNSLRWDVERSGDPYAGFILLGSVPGRGSTTRPTDYRYDDESVPAAGTYYYRLGQVDLDGSKRYYGPVSLDYAGRLPKVDGLSDARPNPFRQGTTVHYQLATARQVKVGVYNVYGQLVRTLAAGHRPAGYHRVVWDGRNDQGRRVSAGVYLVRLEGAGVSKSARVAVIR